MRTSWLIGALVTFIIGFILTSTIIGAIFGIPLILLSFVILLFGLLLPDKRKITQVISPDKSGVQQVVHIYQHEPKK